MWFPRQKAEQPTRQGERCPFCLWPCSHRQHRYVIGDVPFHGSQCFPATSSALHVQSVPVTFGSAAAASLIRTCFRGFPEYTGSCLTFPPVLNMPYLTQPQRCHHLAASLKTKSYTVFERNTANCCKLLPQLSTEAARSVAFNRGRHMDSMDNLLKINFIYRKLSRSATGAALLCSDFFSCLWRYCVFFIPSSAWMGHAYVPFLLSVA